MARCCVALNSTGKCATLPALANRCCMEHHCRETLHAR
jgi:hypothetical protein